MDNAGPVSGSYGIEDSLMEDQVPDRVVVGREAIHDRALGVAAYELKFTTVDGDVAQAFSSLEEAVTSTAVLNNDVVGLNLVLGDKPVFLEIDRTVVLSDPVPPGPPGPSVLEVHATTGLDADLLAGCRRLADKGFGIALDNFAWVDGIEPLLDVASIVKVDAFSTDPGELAAVVARVRPFDVKVVATNIETPAQLDALRALDIDMFQGYALHQVRTGSAKTASTGSIARLRKAASVLGEMLDFDEIEEILRPEPHLTFQIIKLASMGRFGETRRGINTVREALVTVGSWRVQNWIAMLYANPAGGTVDDSVFNSLMRASACETLARATGSRVNSRNAFAAGMLSSFHELLAISGEEIAQLSLSPELKEAAFGDQSPLARIVCDVADYQSGTRFPRMLSDVTRTDLDVAFATAFQWTNEVTSALA
jgi:EAL and modified HD-GYP domain-containing signal transduction protein